MSITDSEAERLGAIMAAALKAHAAHGMLTMGPSAVHQNALASIRGNLEAILKTVQKFHEENPELREAVIRGFENYSLPGAPENERSS